MNVIEITNGNEIISHSINSASRIVVVGVSGSGKTTLAKKISEKYALANIELDELFWKANWEQSTNEEFRKKVEDKINSVKGFVIHGNYNKIIDLTWGNADTVVWLDYSLPLIMWRVIKRTIVRIFTRQELWNGNIETFKKSFLEKGSIIWWAWTTYNKRRKQYNELKLKNGFSIKEFIVVKRSSLVRKLL